MIIDTIVSNGKDNLSSPARFLKNVKLPNVDPNCIFTSRSVVDTNMGDHLSA